MAEVSIIVPVYKAENFIKRCVDSVISQTYKDWELILVDDGSPDKSGAICDEYAKSDSRIKVLHKENGGVSSARNFAIEYINSSNWITCLDSDDEIQPSFLQSFFNGILPNNIDFAFLSDFICCRDSILSSSRVANPNVYYEGNFVSFIEKYIDHPALKSVHANFFRTGIVKNNNVKFNPNIRNGEDHIFVLEYLLYIKSAQIVEGNGYIYYLPQEYSLKYGPKLSELKYKFSIMEKYVDQIASIHGINLDWAKEAKWLNGLSCIDIFSLYHPDCLREYLDLYCNKLHSRYETDTRCNRDIRTINILLHLVDNKGDKRFSELLDLFIASAKTPLKYIKGFPVTSKIAILISFLRSKMLLTLYFTIINKMISFRR